MYSTRDLLKLVYEEKADALEVHVGSPPVIVLRGEDYVVEGPAVTPEHAQDLLREIATSRQIRDLLRFGSTGFLLRHRGQARYTVRAALEAGYVGFDVFTIRNETGGASGAASRPVRPSSDE